MQPIFPLDDPFSERRVPPRRGRATRIAFILEMVFWAGRLLSALFIIESAEGGTELFIISTALLGILYVGVPHLLLGSRDRWERILSFGVGGSLGLVLLSGMLYFGSWPGASELVLIAMVLTPLVGVGLLVSLIQKPARWREGTFYKHALIRWGLAAWFLFGLF